MQAVKALGVCVISWLAGLGAYCYLWFRFDGRIRTSELIAVAFWMAFAIWPFLIFYAVAVSKLNQSAEPRGALSYGVVCALIGVLPIALLNLVFGGFSFGQLLAPENQLLFAHFGTAGFTFGILYAVFLRPASATSQRDRE